MTVAAPPRPPRRFDPEALFEEARRHRRHRRLRLALVVAVLLAAGIGAYAALSSGTNHARSAGGRAADGEKDVAVVLLVDVSGSMRATDVKPTRLDAAIAAMRVFVASLPANVQVGLVSFSDTAKVVVAPTRDRTAVLTGLTTLGPLTGTALGLGLAAAVRLTMTTLVRQGIRRQPGRRLPATIVLESDGAQNLGPLSPDEAAARARAAGIRIDGIALGTPAGKVHLGQYADPVPPAPGTGAARA